MSNTNQCEEKQSFQEVWALFRARWMSMGPHLPVDNHKLAAGLLFQKWNDRTSRVLENERGKYPRVSIIWRDRPVFIYVTSRAVEELLTRGALEGTTSEWGFTDWERLRLSFRGKRMVVEEWITGVDLNDTLNAGAEVDLRTGEIRWHQHL